MQPDWVDPNRFDVPQADEQQRLLANLITDMNLDAAPLPRFWYLPRGEKAVLTLTGDDHATGGTPAYLEPAQDLRQARLLASPTGSACARRRTCIPDTPMTRRAGRRPTRRTASSSRCTTARAARTSRRRRCAASYTSQLARVPRELAEPARAGHQPHALHRLERLGDAAQGRARRTASASTRTTTTSARRPGWPRAAPA